MSYHSMSSFHARARPGSKMGRVWLIWPGSSKIPPLAITVFILNNKTNYSKKLFQKILIKNCSRSKRWFFCLKLLKSSILYTFWKLTDFFSNMFLTLSTLAFNFNSFRAALCRERIKREQKGTKSEQFILKAVDRDRWCVCPGVIWNGPFSRRSFSRFPPETFNQCPTVRSWKVKQRSTSTVYNSLVAFGSHFRPGRRVRC